MKRYLLVLELLLSLGMASVAAAQTGVDSNKWTTGAPMPTGIW